MPPCVCFQYVVLSIKATCGHCLNQTSQVTWSHTACLTTGTLSNNSSQGMLRLILQHCGIQKTRCESLYSPPHCLVIVAIAEQRSFQLTEEQYMEKMDGVSYRLNVLGQTTLVRSFLQQPARAKGGLPKRPVMGTAVSHMYVCGLVILCTYIAFSATSAHLIQPIYISSWGREFSCTCWLSCTCWCLTFAVTWIKRGCSCHHMQTA